jgi:hypothetical protein
MVMRNASIGGRRYAQANCEAKYNSKERDGEPALKANRRPLNLMHSARLALNYRRGPADQTGCTNGRGPQACSASAAGFGD